MRISRNDSNVQALIAELGRSIYRPWFFANFGKPEANKAFKSEWALALSRFDRAEVVDGLRRWASEHGVEHPPASSAEFARFLRPSHTPASRSGLAGIKAILQG